MSHRLLKIRNRTVSNSDPSFSIANAHSKCDASDSVPHDGRNRIRRHREVGRLWHLLFEEVMALSSSVKSFRLSFKDAQNEVSMIMTGKLRKNRTDILLVNDNKQVTWAIFRCCAVHGAFSMESKQKIPNTQNSARKHRYADQHSGRSGSYPRRHECE